MNTIIDIPGKVLKRTTVRALLADTIAYIFIFLFLYTAASKLIDIETFKNALYSSVLLESIAPAVAYGIPLAEIGVAVALIIPRTRQAGIFLSFLLMIVFTAYLLYMVFFASTKACHCGGVVSNLSWEQHIWFNLAFIVLAIIGLLMQNFQLINFLTFKSKKS